jgi:hypothetical protein
MRRAIRPLMRRLGLERGMRKLAWAPKYSYY